jgi:hypothetical protein
MYTISVEVSCFERGASDGAGGASYADVASSSRVPARGVVMHHVPHGVAMPSIGVLQTSRFATTVGV